MSPREEILDLMEKCVGRVNVIAVPVPFLKLTGDADSALLLSQLLYWTDRARDDSGWVFKSREDWHDELCLNRYRLDKSRRRLRELDIVEESHHLVGARRVLHLRIRQTNLRTSLRALLSSRQAAHGDEDDHFSLESRCRPAQESETPLPKNPAVQEDPTGESQPPGMPDTSRPDSSNSPVRSGGFQRVHVPEDSRPECGITTLRTVELEPFERSKVDRSGLETTPETTSEIPAQTTAETSGEMEKARNKKSPELEQSGAHQDASGTPSRGDAHGVRLAYRALREMYQRQARERPAEKGKHTFYEDRLFEILERASGFPKDRSYSTLDGLLAEFPGVDHFRTFGRFAGYWQDRTLVRPWQALRKWLERASDAASRSGTREPVRTFIWRTAPNGMCYTESIRRMAPESCESGNGPVASALRGVRSRTAVAGTAENGPPPASPG